MKIKATAIKHGKVICSEIDEFSNIPNFNLIFDDPGIKSISVTYTDKLTIKYTKIEP